MEPLGKPRWILIPEINQGFGTGHMFRCLGLAQELLSNQVNDFWVIIPLSHRVASLFPEIKKQYVEPEDFSKLISSKSKLLKGATFVLDKPRLSTVLVQDLKLFGKVMALDGGGEGRSLIPYLVDTLPNLFTDSSINSPWLLNLPKLKSHHQHINRNPHVLIAMGGEDKAGLTIKLLHSKPVLHWLKGAQVTVLQGPGMDPVQLQIENRPGWHILPSMPNLKDQLFKYDLVITIFGLTAYEAMASGTPVLLVHPTRYHKRLANHANLPDLFSVMKSTPNLSSAYPQLLPSLQRFLDSRPAPKDYPRLVRLVMDYHEAPGKACPCCSSSDAKVMYRFSDRTFLTCGSCSTEYQLLTKHHGINYTSEYFFEDYKSQYGKDYLEDFDHIKAQGLRRLHQIEALGSKQNLLGQQPLSINPPRRLLDLGCAFGPFLQAGFEFGYQVHGIDVSKEGVNYIINQLGLSAEVADVFSLSTNQDSFYQDFDVISLWYVIEHFDRVEPLLKILFQMLKPGGILAIGTPSSHGISRKRNPQGFFSSSPKDHFSLWNPRQARKVLSSHGFIIKTILCPSFHRTRYPKLLQNSWFEPLLRFFHHRMLLGDTIEIYCQKPETIL